MKRLVLVAMVCSIPWANGAEPPTAVRFDELQQHPKAYNGKRVTLRVYLVTSCPHCRDLWASVARAHTRSAQEHVLRNSMFCGEVAPRCKTPKGFPESLIRQDYDGYVRITGTFEYVAHWAPEKMKGFGWSALADKQITNITELRPLGQPIPFHFNFGYHMPNQTLERTADRRETYL